LPLCGLAMSIVDLGVNLSMLLRFSLVLVYCRL